MDTKVLIELIGYLGSALVVVSMLMTSVVKLRVVNTVGSAIFMGYALVIGSYPTALMNLFLIAINAYHLVRLFRNHKEYDLVAAAPDDGFVKYFLDKYHADIAVHFPLLTEKDARADRVLLVCCGGDPAGIFLANNAGNGDLEVLLDYAVPAYRDTSAGQFLYAQLKEKGYRRLIARGDAEKHRDYLIRMGFRQEGDKFILDLGAK